MTILMIKKFRKQVFLIMKNKIYEETKHGLVTHLPKEIDHHSADEIKKVIDRKIEFDCISNIIFDFSDTEFMDSSGIGLLLGRYKMVQYLGGRVSAVNVTDNIVRMIKMSGIDKFISVKGL